jgi:hypothetical protein
LYIENLFEFLFENERKLGSHLLFVPFRVLDRMVVDKNMVHLDLEYSVMNLLEQEFVVENIVEIL